MQGRSHHTPAVPPGGGAEWGLEDTNWGLLLLKPRPCPRPFTLPGKTCGLPGPSAPERAQETPRLVPVRRQAERLSRPRGLFPERGSGDRSGSCHSG